MRKLLSGTARSAAPAPRGPSHECHTRQAPYFEGMGPAVGPMCCERRCRWHCALPHEAARTLLTTPERAAAPEAPAAWPAALFSCATGLKATRGATRFWLATGAQVPTRWVRAAILDFCFRIKVCKRSPEELFEPRHGESKARKLPALCTSASSKAGAASLWCPIRHGSSIWLHCCAWALLRTCCFRRSTFKCTQRMSIDLH